MNIPTEILADALIIGASIALTSRWSVSGLGGGTVLLNRWTGEVVWCAQADTTPGRFNCQAR
ncbi:hypothetical protein [Tardiphaga sp.]|uniref:hypothetical protein n=1 Tax=Tardiphaga sp. TaxID=1926292 RepID=UPI0026324555|nr:hypothetical protein [Tardiphaga sp.]MDB5616612.1 hypothetical protein [Tardiphaga sp.]